MHNIDVPEHIKSVKIERLFPEGKSYYCCLCNNIIASFPNFKRHFKNKHKGISFNISAKCMLCNRSFSDNRGAGVHLIRTHHIGKNTPYPLSPTPAMSFVDLEDPANNTIEATSPFPNNKTTLTQLMPRIRLRRLSTQHTTPPYSSPTSCSEEDIDSHYDSVNLLTPKPPCQTPTPDSPLSRYPKPSITDLEDDEESISCPPRPSGNSTNNQPSLAPLEPVVALSGSTAGESDEPSSSQSSEPQNTTTDSGNPFNIPPLTEAFFASTPSTSVPSKDTNSNPQNNTSFSYSECDPFQQRWSSAFPDDISWGNFSAQCYKFADDVVKTSAQRFPKKKSACACRPFRPSARPVNTNRTPLRYNPREA